MSNHARRGTPTQWSGSSISGRTPSCFWYWMTRPESWWTKRGSMAWILRPAGMALETRRALPGLERQRADAIVAGAVSGAEGRGVGRGVALERLAVARGGAV